MPNSICFAGGAIDKTDETRDWIDFLKKHKIPLEELQRKTGSKKPFIYDQPEGLLDRETSLRLTAIRETFEELGVIFCRDPNEPQTSPFSTFFHAKGCDIPVWQKKVHDHKESLMSFCEHFKVVPDVTNIFEWSCWLTPTFFRPRRFETAFFLVALNSMPPVYPEAHEVQDFQVSFHQVS
jgi:nucleoside diphosphate-linked moiety X motif 19, mitochondrial